MSSDNYDPKAIVFTFLGQSLSGYADGTFVKVERNEDAMKLVVGADGESTRTRSRNKSGKITLTLRQESVSNDVLSAARQLDERGLPGGRGPCSVKDLRGTTLAHADDAWIVKSPPIERGKDAGSSEWVFETGSVDLFAGSNVL